MNRRASFLPGLILIVGAMLPAQEQKLGAPVITNYETEQFKALSQNWAAVQDQRGIMYFANNAGILEFDGQHWRLIPVPGNATVRDLAFGPDGTIFYGSVDDFGYLATSPTGSVFAVSLGEAIRKTCSIGYVGLPVYREQPGLLTFEQCTMIADLGLLYAKGQGRDQGILLEAGPRIPSGKEIIQRTVTSLEFALNEGYLQINGLVDK